MSQRKTQKTDASVEEFLDSIDNEKKREDVDLKTLHELVKQSVKQMEESSSQIGF